eukprot:TRINITY_DN67453_c6_g2_i2.p1 TRINITY_DN67453_c6_g2~~TRINITY_DN67453_c6_g2_i2.p1  ORF type:complete len:716 (-),score=107.27 TRINITY_DN67453_c6_g2_i2:2617-4764(-)
MVRVAIIGGGISGLMCATQLCRLDHQPTVFDTGKRGVGGRLASRTMHGTVVDHGCQCFTASNPAFVQLATEWERLGWIRLLPTPRIWRVDDAKSVQLQTQQPMWIGSDGGMEELPRTLAAQLPKVVSDCWVNKVLRKDDNKWEVFVNDLSQGTFDFLVIAHNGKCATRLSAAKGMERINAGLRKIQLLPMFVLLAAFEPPSPVTTTTNTDHTTTHNQQTVVFTIVDNNDTIAWITTKTDKTTGQTCYTVFSTPEFGMRFKVPQEFIPDEDRQRITAILLEQLQSVTLHQQQCTATSNDAKIAPIVGVPVSTHLQLWGAALPKNTLQHHDFLLDPHTLAGSCGDWCVSPNVEGAVLSGIRLADAIDARCTRQDFRDYTSNSFTNNSDVPSKRKPKDKQPNSAGEPTLTSIGVFHNLVEVTNANENDKNSQVGNSEAVATSSDQKEAKMSIRMQMWNMMEERDIADQPRPVHHRIPNFKGSAVAANKLMQLPIFQNAKIIKCNPDTPQKELRYHTLLQNKTLLVPTPKMKEGLVRKIQGGVDLTTNKDCQTAATTHGGKAFGQLLSYGDTIPKIDLVVVGSSVVSRDGIRLGKGEGFAEIEYALLRECGVIADDAPVVTTVHDLQVREIDTNIVQPYDVPVDIIVTPTEIIYTQTRLPKPTGILWHLLTHEKIQQIPLLAQLQKQAKTPPTTQQPAPSAPMAPKQNPKKKKAKSRLQ